ncbi:MAG: zf-HC2 domain-containing protein [Armatimonadota bacterium]|nr:MAG: zf-HC2 domain-containing protein [Armatimonadota bacterium]
MGVKMGLRHLSEAELIEYVDGETSPSRRDRVEGHLGRCARCAAEVAKLREVVSAVGTLEAAAAPGYLRERVRAEMEAPPTAEVTCRQAAPLIHQHLDGHLPPADEALLHHHVSACSRCRMELAALASAKRLVELLPSVESPAVVREAVAAARRARRPNILWKPRWGVAVAVASVAMIGVLALLSATRQPGEIPEGVRVAEEPVRPAAHPVVVAESRESALEDAGMGEIGEAEERVAAETPRPPIPEVETRRSTETREVAHLVPGPAPAPTPVEPRPPEVPLPSALRALRAVARSASPDREVRLAMEIAGERFATLDSERMWARLPSGLDFESGDETDAASEDTGLRMPAAEEPAEDGDPIGDSAWAPGGEGAGPLTAPLV